MRTFSFPSETRAHGGAEGRFPRHADAIALARPTLLIPLWTMHVLGAIHAYGSMGSWRPRWTLPRDFLLLSAAQTFLIAAVYVFNQMTDADTDAKNRKLFLVSDGLVSRRWAWSECIALAGASALLLLVRGGFDRATLTLFGISAVLGILYSLPPIRLKGRAGLDLLANSIGFGGIAFAVGWSSVLPIRVETWQTATPYVLSVAATFLFTTIPDIEGDRAAGLRTSGVVLGPRRSAWAAIVLLVGAVLAAVAARNVIALTALLIALAPYTRAAARIHRGAEDARLVVTTRLVILVLSGLAVLGVPAYGVLLLAVILWTRSYYAKRFGMRYP